MTTMLNEYTRVGQQLQLSIFQVRGQMLMGGQNQQSIV